MIISSKKQIDLCNFPSNLVDQFYITIIYNVRLFESSIRPQLSQKANVENLQRVNLCKHTSINLVRIVLRNFLIKLKCR